MADVDKKISKRVRNVVHDDAIWRQTINYELHTAKNWDTTWGFIREAQKQKASSKDQTRLPPLIKKEQKRDLFASGLPSNLTTGLSSNPNSIIADWLLTYDVPKIVNFRYPASKYMYPATTSTEIGWPWGRNSEFSNSDGDVGRDLVTPSKRKCRSLVTPKIYTLERFGNHARGKQENLDWYGGSLESLP